MAIENGHGSLNAGIIVGYDQRNGAPYQDSDGQHLGLGLNPFGRVGSTGDLRARAMTSAIAGTTILA